MCDGTEAATPTGARVECRDDDVALVSLDCGRGAGCDAMSHVREHVAGDSTATGDARATPTAARARPRAPTGPGHNVTLCSPIRTIARPRPSI